MPQVCPCSLTDHFCRDARGSCVPTDVQKPYQLRSTQEDHIRIDTMCAANDKAGNLVYALPIFKLLDLVDNKTLGDADGQKLATSESTIQLVVIPFDPY